MDDATVNVACPCSYVLLFLIILMVGVSPAVCACVYHLFVHLYCPLGTDGAM